MCIPDVKQKLSIAGEQGILIITNGYIALVYALSPPIRNHPEK